MSDPISADTIAHLETMAAVYRRRLRILEVQCARFDVGLIPTHLVTEREDVARDLARTLADLRRLRPTLPNEQAPYVGLLAFQEADAERFFGRDALIAELVDHIAHTTFLAVLGPSGSGKSSVVRAGLIPTLKGGVLPGSDRWQYATLRPGARPLNALAAALSTIGGGALGDVATIRTTLRGGADGLLLAVDVLRVQQEGAQLVLVVDQAEELWTLAPSDAAMRRVFVTEDQRPFIDLLLTAACAPDSPILIILTMRADFLHRAAEHPALARAIAQHVAIVSPMTADELRDAIVRPAETAGSGFEAGLVEALVAQTVERAGGLPLLEFTLRALWEDREADGTLTWMALHALGGVEGGLARRADDILAEQYTLEQLARLRAVLLRLIQPGEGVADARRRVALADLAPADSAVVDVQSLLQPLVEARLLTSGRDTVSGADTIELAHEALIRAWPTLRRWIEEARAELRLHLQLEAAAQEWTASQESPDFLWSGLRLATMSAWVERSHPLLSARNQAFLTASQVQEQVETELIEAARQQELVQTQERAAERASTARRLRRLVIGLVGVLGVTVLALIAAGVFGTQATQRATEVQTQLRVAESQRLAFAAQSQVAAAPETALLLAYEAAAQDQNAVSEQTLRNALDGVNWCPYTLQGHTGTVNSATFSPDGQRIVTASYDRTARVWDAAGRPLATLESHTGLVYSAAFSPDGQRIVTTSDDRTARVWDVAGQPLATLEGHTGLVYSAAFSPDGQRIVTASYDRTARVWDAAGRPLATLKGHTGLVYSAAFSPDGQWIVTASYDGTARVWGAAGRPLATLEGHTGPVTSAAFSPDGQRIVTASLDETARVWDVAGQPLATLEGHTGLVTSAAFSPDGQRIVTASYDRTARVWDVADQPLATLEGHTGPATSAAFSPDGQRIVTASDDRTARVWDVAGQPLATLEGHIGLVNSAAFSPDGQRIVTASDDRTARVWGAAGQPLATLEGHTGLVNSAAFSPDGQRIVTASYDGTARVWDVEGRPLATLEGHIGPVTSAAFSPDGQRIVTASYDGTARVWDVEGRPLATLEGHTGLVNSAAFSPDGQRIVTTSWDGTARVWDAAGRPLATLEGHTGLVNSAAFSPNGQQIVTASDDRTARVWDAAGRPLATLKGHTGAVNGVAFSPDGQRIVTASLDGTARQYLVHVDDLLAVAVCLVGRGLTDEEIARFQVLTPLHLDFAERQCPPVVP